MENGEAGGNDGRAEIKIRPRSILKFERTVAEDVVSSTTSCAPCFPHLPHFLPPSTPLHTVNIIHHHIFSTPPSFPSSIHQFIFCIYDHIHYFVHKTLTIFTTVFETSPKTDGRSSNRLCTKFCGSFPSMVQRSLHDRTGLSRNSTNPSHCRRIVCCGNSRIF